MDRPPRETFSTQNVAHVKREFVRAPEWPAAISLREVLRCWKVHPATLYALANEGKLAGSKIGNRVVFPEDQLRRELGEPVVEPNGDLPNGRAKLSWTREGAA